MAEQEKKLGEMPEQVTVTEPEQTQEETKTVTVEELQAEKERLERSLQNKAEEAERVHNKLAAYEEAERKRKEAEMTELEKLQAQNKELQEKAQKAAESAKEQARNAEVIRLAATLGFADPKDAIKFVDSETEVDGLEDALKELAEKKPYLLKTESKVTPSLRAAHSGNPKTGETPEERRARLLS